MGLAPRRTARAVLLAAVPLVLGSAALGSAALGVAPALAGPRVAAQAGDGKVAANAAFKFDPATITVPVGGKVTWTNTGGGSHTVTGGDGTPDASSPIARGIIDTPGKTYTATFPKAGTYTYYCEPHLALGMKGEVVVGAGAATSAPPSASAEPTETSAPSASATASAPAGGEGTEAPAAEPSEGEEEAVPGVAGNKTLESIEHERASYHGAVSGFQFFTMVSMAFLVILGAAVLFSTRPRRAGR